MKTRLLFAFAVVALAVASAKSYTVNIYENAKAGGTELKAGEYKLEVVDQNAVIRRGKVESKIPIKVETAQGKYSTTSVVYDDHDGAKQIREIHLGGTATKLVLNN